MRNVVEMVIAISSCIIGAFCAIFGLSGIFLALYASLPVLKAVEGVFSGLLLWLIFSGIGKGIEEGK